MLIRNLKTTNIAGVFAGIFIIAASAHANTEATLDLPKRPTILFNRWQEDWSVLANPKVPRERLDSLKYIPLSASDPKTYLSFGANWRNRYEYNNAMDFGVGSIGMAQSYVITRMEAHADLHIANQIQAFVQLQNDYAPAKKIILPVDEDRLDLEQAFITVTEPVAAGLFKLRAGRQQMAFDLQRFVSVRDGPNVRQSYDAIWADYEKITWRYIAYFSHPVQARNIRCFDDFSSSALRYGGFRIEHKLNDSIKLSSYLSQYNNKNAFFPSVMGSERRNLRDIRFVGKGSSFDWDIETMGQVGTIANQNIRAWGFGSISGYTFEHINLKPRIGLQLDAASGNQKKNGSTLGTFNPLFPNGAYVTLAGYTGYTNFIHLKPSLTLTPYPSVTAMFAIAGLWRESTADAVYIQPYIPVPGTVGVGGQYTGTYVQTHIDWQMTPHIHNMFEMVYFNVANAIQKVGGHNSTYAGLETKISW
jgi:hypothetical protein